MGEESEPSAIFPPKKVSLVQPKMKGGARSADGRPVGLRVAEENAEGWTVSDGGLLLTVVDTRPGFGIGIDNEAGVLTRMDGNSKTCEELLQPGSNVEVEEDSD